MAYSTVDDLTNYMPQKVLVQLTDDTRAGVVDSAKINDAIRRADDLIDGYIRGRYELPLATVPALIRDLSTKLAVYFLYKRSLTLTLPEPAMEDYKDSTRVLVRIQQGTINPFPLVSEPAFFASNKTGVASTMGTITNSWGSYLI